MGKANLRVCASCEWVYRGDCDCPQCGFGSYGARWVYKDRCYRYAKTQEPWLEKKLREIEGTLRAEIKEKAKHEK